MALERKDVDKKYKWDLSVIYKDENAFFDDYKKCENMISDFKKHEKTMCSSAESFYNTLKDMTDIDAMIERLWQYSSLGFAVDTSDNNAQSLNARVRNLAVSAGEATWFVSPYMLKLDTSIVDKWFAEYPLLASYRRMVDKNMRYKPHTLSDECEILMSKMQDALGSHGDIRSIFSNSDLRFGKITDADGKRVDEDLRNRIQTGSGDPAFCGAQIIHHRPQNESSAQDRRQLYRF